MGCSDEENLTLWVEHHVPCEVVVVAAGSACPCHSITVKHSGGSIMPLSSFLAFTMTVRLSGTEIKINPAKYKRGYVTWVEANSLFFQHDKARLVWEKSLI